MTLAIMQAELPPGGVEAPEPAENWRSLRWRLRDMSGRILAGTAYKRVAKCGQKLVGPQATVCKGPGGAYVAGVETCGSVWACPSCAAKISEGRRLEVRECLDGHVKAGGDVFMALFTIPHKAMESCLELREAQAAAWRKMIAGAPWQRAKERYGIVGNIRALEVTHGANGYHPHIHALFFTRALSEVEEAELRIWLGDRWATIIERMTGKAVNLAKGFGFQRACSVVEAGDYVAKWGTDSEIAKASSKMSRKGGRSPWQLLADAIDGDHRARMIFREYAVSMKGARHLTWSRGLRDLYVKTPELDDIELAKQDAPFHGDEQVIAFRRFVYFKLIRAGVMPDVLSAAETAGRSGVLSLLRARGLALPEATFYERHPQSYPG